MIAPPPSLCRATTRQDNLDTRSTIRSFVEMGISPSAKSSGEERNSLTPFATFATLARTMGDGVLKRGDLVNKNRDDDSSAMIIAPNVSRNSLPFEREPISPGHVDCRVSEARLLDRKRQADALQPLRQPGHARGDSFLISNPFGSSRFFALTR